MNSVEKGDNHVRRIQGSRPWGPGRNGEGVYADVPGGLGPSGTADGPVVIATLSDRRCEASWCRKWARMANSEPNVAVTSPSDL